MRRERRSAWVVTLSTIGIVAAIPVAAVGILWGIFEMAANGLWLTS